MPILPGDRRIERTEKMGVVSNGMLCSGDELGLTSDADGILILAPDAPIGVPLVDLYGDVVLDIDVKPNRGDALSIFGLAREVAAATGTTLREPDTSVEETGEPVESLLQVEVDEPELCTRFVGRHITGVRIGPSPDRIQMRLLAAGMRPVSNVVDASNYVMAELGKPVHTFDAKAVRGGRIVVRLARPGERLETLDHVERELSPDTLVIADESGPIAIAGVMGGASSEVADSTTDVAIESAIFDPVTIRRTAFRYALRSEASLRFEKGLDVRLARTGADRTARLVHEWAGGTVAKGRIDTAPVEPGPVRVAFRPGRINRLLGTDLSAADQANLLARVGVDTEAAPDGTPIRVAAGSESLDVPAGDAEAMLAVVPTWRRDLVIEADIAEEVARVNGYELTPSTLPDTPMPPYRADPLEVRDLVRETLAGAGLTEIVSHALVTPEDVERFPPLEDAAVPAGEGAAGGPPVTVTNPLSRDHSVLRQSLLGSLLGVLATNLRRGRADVAIFEIGRGYGRAADGAVEWSRLGVVRCGLSVPAYWADPPRDVDLDDVKGAIELLARRLDLAEARYQPLTNDPNLHPGRSARVRVDRADGSPGIVGRVGELHPGLIADLELRTERVVVAELAIAGLSGGRRPAVRASSPSRQPVVERDLAVVVPQATSAATVAEMIAASGGAQLIDVRLFDVYRGAPLGPDDKSLAWRLVFQATDRTLQEAEVDAAIAAITTGLEGLGGRIRS